MVQNLQSEKDKLREILRQELKNEVETLKKELNSVKADRDKELQQVYSRQVNTDLQHCNAITIFDSL